MRRGVHRQAVRAARRRAGVGGRGVMRKGARAAAIDARCRSNGFHATPPAHSSAAADTARQIRRCRYFHQSLACLLLLAADADDGFDMI